jgi:hypothetical protein
MSELLKLVTWVDRNMYTVNRKLLTPSSIRYALYALINREQEIFCDLKIEIFFVCTNLDCISISKVAFFC